MQICTKLVTFDNIACTSPWGNMYETSLLSLGNYAENFIETPIISIVPAFGAGGYSACFVEFVRNVSNSSFGQVCLCRPNSVTTNFSLHLTAIGKWK